MNLASFVGFWPYLGDRSTTNLGALRFMLRPRGLHLSSIAKLLGSPFAHGAEGDPLHVFLCVADHYEPMALGATGPVQQERVRRWTREYPRSVDGICDSRGRPPQHTFFYPAEEDHPDQIEAIAGLCRQGFGDVEVHLHHDDDTPDALRETLLTFKRNLHDRHGLLRKNRVGDLIYAFIHGNWALDNSRPDGRWCGVNNELDILRETGCYVDMTMPSCPSDAQTRTINSIYYAVDDPSRPKSHDKGVLAAVHAKPPEGSLLLIQGPLGFDWGRRKYGLLPRVENGDLRGGFPPTMDRFNLWLRAGVGVVGRPDWRFVKLHTHGAPEANADILLGPAMRHFHEQLAVSAKRNARLKYYYVTAYEMAALVHLAESGAATPVFEGLTTN